MGQWLPVKREVLQMPEGGVGHIMRGPRGEAQLSELPGDGGSEKGKWGQEPLLWLLWEGMGEVGRAVLGLAGLLQQALGHITDPRCLVPGTGVVGADGQWPGV